MVLIISIKGCVDGRFDPGNRDGMRADTESFFQMDAMAEKPQYFKLPVIKAEKGTDSYIIDTGLHGPVQAVKPPLVIRLTVTGRMKQGIGFVVIGFLEDLEGSYTCLQEFFIILHLHGGSIDVYPPDFSILYFCIIYYLHGPAYKISIIIRMFSIDQDQSLMALFLQGNDFLFQFFHIQTCSFN